MTYLNQYVTYKMALELLGAKPDQTTRLYRFIDDGDIEVLAVGNMHLINRKQFCEAAGVPSRNPDNPVRWPVHIAMIEVNELVSIGTAAEILGLTARQTYNLGTDYKITMYDLSEWGGQNVLLKSVVMREKEHRDAQAAARIAKKQKRGSRASRA